MSPVVIIMAILGCGDDGGQCQLVQHLPATYASVAACNTDAERALGQLAHLDYPTIMARCQAAPEGLAANVGGVMQRR